MMVPWCGACVLVRRARSLSKSPGCIRDLLLVVRKPMYVCMYVEPGCMYVCTRYLAPYILGLIGARGGG